MFPLPLVITSHYSKVRVLSSYSSGTSSFPDMPVSIRDVMVLIEILPPSIHQSTNPSIHNSLELLKEYRKLDDAVTTRINRTTAQFRDRDRLGASGKGSVQEQACAYLWKELVGARGQNPIITRRLDVFYRSKSTGNAELKLSIIV
jgi:hypothetical protein